MIADGPRLLRDEQQITLRRSQLVQQHIKPLTDFATTLRQRGYGKVPDFDPWDGGVSARVLFLFEKPGPKAFASGFISRNNDDPTAANTFKFMEEARIPRKKTCIWNVVPGWNGTTKLTGSELRAGAVALSELLVLLKNLRVAVLVGKRACRAWDKIDKPNIPTITSAHPSPIVYATARDIWNAIPSRWASVVPYLE